MLEPINYVFVPVEYRGVCSGYEYKSIEVAMVRNGESHLILKSPVMAS